MAPFGAAELAHARPDGYTLAVIPASVYREPHLNRVHFDPLKLTYVIGLSDYTFGLAVKQDAPWQTWQDFVEDARKRPGNISIGAAGWCRRPTSCSVNWHSKPASMSYAPPPAKATPNRPRT
ncbi:tripartite tricarboxylate transporter substrate-binding protein [Bordetella trematum]|uniref:tripartite tricarboxylate transporter substrate-binding protein n=1 Tax=Bordetella trematum TaxID=123899 RepID=UPI003AF33B4D